MHEYALLRSAGVFGTHSQISSISELVTATHPSLESIQR
jgi:hypothetical protein